jgi:hypothetical protein
LWYCLSCTSHKLLLSWTKLINVSQSIMIYVIIGRKEQTELNSTDLRPTSVVIGRQGRLYWDQARAFQLVWKDWASSADVGRRPYRPMSAPLWPRPNSTSGSCTSTSLSLVFRILVITYPSTTLVSDAAIVTPSRISHLSITPTSGDPGVTGNLTILSVRGGNLISSTFLTFVFFCFKLFCFTHHSTHFPV